MFYPASRVPLIAAVTLAGAQNLSALGRLQLRAALVIKIAASHTITVLDFSDEHIIRGPGDG